MEHVGLSPAFWPYACRHYSHARNIECKDGDSGWNKRRQRGQWTGTKIPFGSLVYFIPTWLQKSDRSKFGANAVPGVILQYVITAGGRWKGDCGVMAKFEYDELDLNDPNWPSYSSPHRVKGFIGIEMCFPLPRSMR